MAIKNALRLRLKSKFTSAGLQTLKSDAVDFHKIYCIQQIAWEIDVALSGGNLRARLYIEGHGYNHNLEEQDNPLTAFLYTYSEPLWLIPGEKLCLELDQGQANTTAEMHLTGYWTEFKEGIV